MTTLVLTIVSISFIFCLVPLMYPLLVHELELTMSLLHAITCMPQSYYKHEIQDIHRLQEIVDQIEAAPKEPPAFVQNTEDHKQESDNGDSSKLDRRNKRRFIFKAGERRHRRRNSSLQQQQ